MCFVGRTDSAPVIRSRHTLITTSDLEVIAHRRLMTLAKRLPAAAVAARAVATRAGGTHPGSCRFGVAPSRLSRPSGASISRTASFVAGNPMACRLLGRLPGRRLLWRGRLIYPTAAQALDSRSSAGNGYEAVPAGDRLAKWACRRRIARGSAP